MFYSPPQAKFFLGCFTPSPGNLRLSSKLGHLRKSESSRKKKTIVASRVYSAYVVFITFVYKVEAPGAKELTKALQILEINRNNEVGNMISMSSCFWGRNQHVFLVVCVCEHPGGDMGTMFPLTRVEPCRVYQAAALLPPHLYFSNKFGTTQILLPFTNPNKKTDSLTIDVVK